MDSMPTITDVRAAAERIEPHVHRTPVLTSRSLNQMVGAELFFKCENFQRTGSFKMRGASNAVFSLSETHASKGVTTHSSGNFAAALALAAQERGIAAHVVMPRNAPEAKKSAVAGYRAKITLCEPTLAAREEGVEAIVAETGATFVHPYDDNRIIAGQGTAALELISEVDALDLVLAPVGGGGLMSGTAIAVRESVGQTRVIGVEPELADDGRRSLEAGQILPSDYPETICDGLRTSLGTRTFPILRKYVDDICLVSDESTLRAMTLLLERMKMVVEPSAAVCLAALLDRSMSIRNKRIGVIISGGNVDLKKFLDC